MTRAFNRFIACIAPDLNAAQGISPVFTALSVLFGGYMITKVRDSKLQNHRITEPSRAEVPNAQHSHN
jgi:hypothetical protein